jgi:hypothetical protein
MVCESPNSKITREKLTKGVAQAEESMLCKQETQSSNPNPTPHAHIKKVFASWDVSSPPFTLEQHRRGCASYLRAEPVWVQ